MVTLALHCNKQTSNLQKEYPNSTCCHVHVADARNAVLPCKHELDVFLERLLSVLRCKKLVRGLKTTPRGILRKFEQ